MKKILQFKMMRSLLLIVIAVMGFSSSGWAGDSGSQDGITYDYSTSLGTATVKSVSTTATDENNTSSYYISIPATVTFGSTVCKVTEIGAKAFADCAATSIFIDATNMATIAGDAFGTSLKRLYIKGATPPTFTNPTLSSDCIIFVSKANEDIAATFKGAWTTLADQIKTGIIGEEFIDNNYPNFKFTITKPDTVYISNLVDKTQLTYYIPTGKVSYDGNDYELIGISASNGTDILSFTGATNLKSITIPSNIKYIGSGAFPASLQYIMFDGGVPVIAGSTAINPTTARPHIAINTSSDIETALDNFSSTTVLASDISIPTVAAKLKTNLAAAGFTVNTPSDNSFYSITTFGKVPYWSLYGKVTSTYSLLCPAVKAADLTSVDLSGEKGISTIEEECFKGYSKLGSVKLNSDLQSIKKDVFSTGEKLASMTIPAKVTSIFAPIFDEKSLPDTLKVLATTVPDLRNSSNEIVKTLSIGGPTDKTNYKLMVSYDKRADYKDYNTETAFAWGQYPDASVILEQFSDGIFNYSYTSEKKDSLALVGVVTSHQTDSVFTIPSLVKDTTYKALKTIGADAFAGCANYISMLIPEGVTTIESGAFSGKTSGAIYVRFPSTLKSYTTPFADGVTVHPYFLGSAVPSTFTLGNSSYADITAKDQTTSSLFATAFGKNVANVGGTGSIYYEAPFWYGIQNTTEKGTFAEIRTPNDPTQATYTIPEKILSSTYVRKIVSNAFVNCASMSAITIPDSISIIAASAFSATALKSLTLNHDTTAIKNSTLTTATWNRFDGTPTNVYVYVKKGVKAKLLGKTSWTDADTWSAVVASHIIGDGDAGSTFQADGFNYLVSDSAKATLVSPIDLTKTSYSLPNFATYNGVKYTVNAIGDSAFYNVNNTITYVLPDSVKTLGNGVFNGKAKYIVLPKTLANINSGAFGKCASTLKFYTEASAPAEGTGTTNKGWTAVIPFEITIPTGVSKAYTDKGFTKAYVLGDENSIYSQNGVWYQVYNATNTQAAAINPVDMSSTNLTIANKVIKDNFIVDKIAAEAFSGAALNTVTLSDTMRVIADKAFYNTNLSVITLPATVDSIGQSALMTNAASSGLTLKVIYAKMVSPSKFHAGDTYLPKTGVILQVPTEAAKTAYLKAGWEGYTASDSISVAEKTPAPTPSIDGSDITIVDPNYLNIGSSAVNYSYDSNSFSNYKPTSITIKDAVKKLTLSKDTVSGTVTVNGDSSDKIGLALTISNSKFNAFTNNDTVEIAVDSKSQLGTVTNNGVLIEESGNVQKVIGKTQLAVGGTFDGTSFTTGNTLKLFAQATILDGDSATFLWQLKDTAGVYKDVAKHSAKKADLRALKTLTDSVTVKVGGNYRCLITDYAKDKTAYATLGVYGAVKEMASVKTAKLVLLSFARGHYDGVAQKKDTTIVYNLVNKADTSQLFTVTADFGYSERYASAFVSYYKAGAKTTTDTLRVYKNADGYYNILHITDSVVVRMDTVTPTASEHIDLVNVKVWGNDGILHVSAPQRVTVYIATFDGRMRAVTSEAGDQEFYLGKGIYIIRIEDKTWKIKI